MNTEDEKTEDKDTKPEFKRNPFDLLSYLGMRPKRIEEKYKRYASLNRRTAAATLDIAIAAFTITPIIDLIVGVFMKSRDITVGELRAIQSLESGKALEFAKLLIDSGKLQEFLFTATLQMLILLVIFGICWKLWSATPGKLLFRMKVVDAVTEQTLSIGQIIRRCLGYIPACGCLFLGIVWISFNKRRQGWHDKMAGSVVITIPFRKKKIKDDTEISVEKTIETVTPQ